MFAFSHWFALTVGFVVLLGLGVGLVMGLAGAGGGILAVPILAQVFGMPMQEAMSVGLLAVSMSAIMGTLDGLQKKQVRYRAAMTIACAGIPASALGIHIAQRTSQGVLMTVFALVLCAVAVSIFYQAITQIRGINENAFLLTSEETGRFVWTVTTFLAMVGIGLVSGFATGLLGVGGGFIIIPLLRYFTNLTMISSSATSLMVVALVGTVSILISMLHGFAIPWVFAWGFALSAMFGMRLGRTLMGKLPTKIVQIIFGLILLMVAARLLLVSYF